MTDQSKHMHFMQAEVNHMLYGYLGQYRRWSKQICSSFILWHMLFQMELSKITNKRNGIFYCPSVNIPCYHACYHQCKLWLLSWFIRGYFLLPELSSLLLLPDDLLKFQDSSYPCLLKILVLRVSSSLYLLFHEV